jgi:cytochrome c5
MRWLLVGLFTTAAALAAGQNPPLPEGDGKAIVSGACVTCHGLDVITAKQVSRDEWTGIVERMKGYGSNLDNKQSTTVLDYLAKNFGPKGQAPAPGAPPTTPPTTPPAGGDDTEAAGKALVSGVCSSCHGADLITAKQASRTEWQGIVDRMKSYGMNLDEKQTNMLLDYLVKHYGPKEAASAAGADAGKKVLEGFCASCHDLDIVSGRTGTQAEWQDVVDRMNGRGAGVPDKDVPVLVQYLTKTYGRK